MSILLTGGNGKVARRIAEQLAQDSVPVLRSSRNPEDESTIRFDWADHGTHASAFKQDIASVFVVLPPRWDCVEDVSAFVCTALDNGVRRFVLLSAAVSEPGDNVASPHGRVHHFLKSLHVDKLQVSIIRPAFFMENFSEQKHLTTIRDAGTIYSATGQGREAFVSCEDIAKIAAKCLIGEGDREEYFVVGPHAVSYDEIAQALSHITGKEVTHTKLGAEELKQMHIGNGMPAEYASMMAGLDSRIANGLGEQPNTVIKDLLGREPVSFEEYATRNRAVWI